MNSPLMQSAWTAHQAGEFAEAARLYREILRTNQRNFYALYLLGYLHSQLGRFAEAERLMGDAIGMNPDWPEALYNRGCMLQKIARHDEALVCFERAIALQADFVDAVVNRGFSLLALGRTQEALDCFGEALRSKTDDANLWNSQANALSELGRQAEALASLEKGLTLDPNYADAWSNRGVVFHRLKRHEDAVANLNRAIALKPDLAAAYNNRGNAFVALKRYEQAFADFDRAASMQTNAQGPAQIRGLAEVLMNRGTALLALKRNAEAMASYDRALALRPDLPLALRNRANALVVEKRYEEAARDIEALLKIDPEHKFMPGILAHCRLQSCDWHALERDEEIIAAGLRAGKRVIPPFEYAAIAHSAADQLTCAQIYVADKGPAETPLWRGERYAHRRIRLAYLSADFRNHAVASLISGVFEHHAKDRFEMFGFSFASDRNNTSRSRIHAAFERFIDIERKNDADAAQLIRQMEIDIAVDLMGYTGECRPEILAYRPAPVQVNYLGFPATMAASHIDYIIGDAVVIPEEMTPFYSENIVYLPHTYLPHDSKRKVASRTPTRREAGLPERGFVFCSFNNAYKYSPTMFDVWMRLLHAVEGSVLWLPGSNTAAAHNLAREAAARGVAAERLVFAPFVPSNEEHLARLKLADLFLDTLPFNAHTTTADALWAGLPVLTCLGGTFAGRVAASLLTAAGLPELVTLSLDDYEAAALRLARDASALSAIRARLTRNRSSAPLFDTARFTRYLEAAYETMQRRHARGEKPASFAISAEPVAFAS